MTLSRRTFGEILIGSGACLAFNSGAAATDAAGAGALKLRSGRVEWREDACGVDTLRPRFRWQLKTADGGKNKLQTAFRLRVVDQKGLTVFDSAKIASN